MFFSCKKDIIETGNYFKSLDKYESKVVFDWNEIYLDVERYAAGYRPCPSANALGYLGLANYEACVMGMPDFQSIAVRYNGLNIPQANVNQEYHWPTVINAVNNYLFRRLFPTSEAIHFAKITTLAKNYETQFEEEVGQEIFTRSKNHGEAVASAVWDFMKTDVVSFDGYKDPFSEYDWASRDQDQDWSPTFPGPGEGLFPFWGNARPLAIKEDLKLCQPYEYYATYDETVNSPLYVQAMEVYATNTPSLKFEDEWVGEFWSDDLLNLTFGPPSRFIAIANQVYDREKADLEKSVLANARVGIALHDAAIGCWNSKYHYNLLRPQTYINKVIDATWAPNLDNPLTGDKGISPAFPSYPSGHATFGAAAAEALASVFGYDYGMTDNCHDDRTEFIGLGRTFSSFYEMAQENAYSRIPLGVHFRMDSEEGLRYGTEIGRAVCRLPWKK